MNAATLYTMSTRSEKTYTIPYEYEAPFGRPLTARPNDHRRKPKHKRKPKFPPPPRPTEAEVDEFAVTIAVNANIVDPHFLQMIRWKPGQSLMNIPARKRKRIYEAQARWTDAHLLLTKCMEENHRLMVRRIRRQGNRVRARYWTARPLKHGKTPPPRRRGYLLPAVRKKASDFLLRASWAAPPGNSPQAERSGERQERRSGELLLFAPGGGHSPRVLRKRPCGPPSPNASPGSLTIEHQSPE